MCSDVLIKTRSDPSINICARDMDWWMVVIVVLSSSSSCSFRCQLWHLWCHFTVLRKLTLKLYSYCDAKRLMKNGCQILNDGMEWKRWIWGKNEEDFGNLSLHGALIAVMHDGNAEIIFAYQSSYCLLHKIGTSIKCIKWNIQFR